MKRLAKKIGHALFGVYYVAKSQSSFRILAVYGLVVFSLAILFPTTGLQWFMLSLTVVFLLMAEMINTVAEHLCNLIHRRKSMYIKVIKDISAGVVLLAFLWSAMVSFFVFLPFIIV